MTYQPKFERDRLGRWGATKDAGFTQVVAGSDAYIMEDEFNLMQMMMNEARADIVRQQAHSGVLALDTILNSAASTAPGAVYGNRTDILNGVWVKRFSALINGYRLTIDGSGNNGSADSAVVLPAPPTYGVREDLVFLEAWFQEVSSAAGVGGATDAQVYRYGGANSGTLANDLMDNRKNAETTRRVQLRWRIRTVSGVDFSKFPEGVGYYHDASSTVNFAVQAQGGVPQPITGTTATYVFCSRTERLSFGSGTNGRLTSIEDSGLYVAGDGTQTSKDTLKTLDGYVYAIPLFRVHRRNSGGYRKDNPNGALDYVAQALTFPGTYVGGIGKTFDIPMVSVTGLRVGDTIKYSSGTYQFKILAITGNTLTVLQGSNGTTSDSFSGGSMLLVSDRPDGLFANIIDATDLIDLRRKVSVTGVNYQQVLEEGFDSLIRGNLTTRDTKTAAKEVYGLRRAPLGLPQALQATTIKRADGSFADLTNLLGVDGNCEDLSKWAPYQTPTLALDSANKVYGSNSIKITQSGTGQGITKNIKSLLVSGKYYVAITEIKNGTMPSMFLQYYDGTIGVNSASVTATDKFYTAHRKFQYNGEATAALFIYSGTAGVAGQFAYVDGIRLLEISKAEYDLIDVDPNWTGGDKIGALFPYVDSYPSFVENLLPPFSDWGVPLSWQTEPYTANVGAGTAVQVVVPCVGGKAYTFSMEKGQNIEIQSRNAAGSNLQTHHNSSALKVVTFTTHVNATEVLLYFYFGTAGEISRPMMVEGSTAGVLFVPKGRWFLDKDYLANAHLGTPSTYRFDGVNSGLFNGQRQVFSDALTAQPVPEIVEALMTPQRHVKVTQATPGTWAINDTIKVRNDYGLVTGVVDSDTGTAKITGILNDASNSSIQWYVDDVSKFVVNDVVRYVSNDFIPREEGTITAVDTTNKAVTINFAGGVSNKGSSFSIGGFIVETTAASSSPVVTAAGIAGTWTNLGTKEATYTITTAPTTATTNIKLDYSVVYPPGKGVTYVPSDVDLAEANGQRLVKGTTVSAKANFVGKVSGNTDAVPHVFKHNATNLNTGLQIPSSGNFYEADKPNLDLIRYLDGSPQSFANNTNGVLAQTLFSFDLIRMMEDKFGELFFADCVDLAAKVARLKTVVNLLRFDWWGYGTKPGGNKATVVVWNPNTAAYVNLTNTTNAFITQLFYAISGNVADYVDASGFVHFLAHGDASDGVTASTLFTDYVELSVTLPTAETGYTVLQPENAFPIMSENVLNANQAFPVDLSGWFSGNAINMNAATLSVDSPGVLKVVADGTVGTQGAAHDGATVAIKKGIVSASVYVKGTAGTGLRVVLVSNYNDATWYSPAVIVVCTGDWQLVKVPGFNATTNTASILVMTNTAVATTFYVTKAKIQESPTYTEWTPGRNKKKTLNLLGKVSGSLSENPHRFYRWADPAFVAPSALGPTAENTQSWYDNAAKQDGVLVASSTPTAGQYYQHLVEFDLSHLGMSLSELKKALRKLTVTWVGYGKGDNAGVLTHGATLKVWATAGAGAWYGPQVNSAATPSTINLSLTASEPAGVTTNAQKVYVLVHSTYPAGAASASELYSDYVKLDVELADYVDYVPANIVKVRPETKEVKTMFPAISRRYIGGGGVQEQQVAVAYRYMPYQGGGQAISGLKVLTDTGRAFVTTHGTGKARPVSEALQTEFPLPITTLLPQNSGFKDWDYVNDSLINASVSFASDLLSTNAFFEGASHGSAVGFGNYRKLRIGESLTFTAPIARGVSAANRPNYGNINLANPKASDTNKKALYGVSFLAVDTARGELVLVVMVRATSQMQIDGNALGAADVYKLPGRPLVKGV